MSSKIKVEVLDAVVDGNGKGAVIVLGTDAANRLAGIGYVRILDEQVTKVPEVKPTEPTEVKPTKTPVKRTTK